LRSKAFSMLDSASACRKISRAVERMADIWVGLALG